MTTRIMRCWRCTNDADLVDKSLQEGGADGSGHTVHPQTTTRSREGPAEEHPRPGVGTPMTQPTPEATNPYDLDLHLAGVKGSTPKGEIRLADLAAIASALQELNIRIARFVADQDGPGRTRTYLSQVAELRLSGIRGGRTRLAVGFGSSPHVLRDGEGVLSKLVDQTADRFWHHRGHLHGTAARVYDPAGSGQHG